MADDLDELAARGRGARTKQSDAEAKAKASGAAAERYRTRLIAKASTIPLGWLITGDVQMLGLIILIGVTASLLSHDAHSPPLWPAALHAGILALLLSLKLLAQLGWRRELSWARALPFAVPGYPEMLGDIRGRSSGRYTSGPANKLEMEIALDGAPPDALADIFLGFDRKLKIERRGPALVLTRPDFPGGEHNYPLRRYLHRMTRAVLLPLHARAPIARVSVSLRT